MENTLCTSQKFSISDFLNKNWLAVYLLSLLAYLPFFFFFIWGNHDWEWIKIGTPFFSGVFEGRFSQFILQTSLTLGQIIPILSLSLGLLFFSLTPIILSKIWDIPQNAKNIILLSLILTTSPYTIAWLYFAFLILSCLSWPFFIAIAFYLLQKYRTITSVLISCIIFYLSLGGYPPVINMIGIIIFTLLLNDICIKHLTIKTLFKKYIPFAISIISALILFSITFYYLKKYDLMQPTYNTAPIKLADLSQKLIFSIKVSIEQFLVSKTFMSYKYKYLFLCICLIGCFELFIKMPKTLTHISLFILCLFGLLISSILTTFAATNTAFVLYEPRIEFFSIIYIYLYFSSTILSLSNRLTKNLAYIALFFIIISNYQTLSYAQKIWKQGFLAEANLSDRIIKRIENHPKFDINKKYTFLQGGVLNFRGRFHTPIAHETVDTYFITAPYIPWHLPTKNYKLFYPKDAFGKDFDVYWSTIPPTQININTAMTQYIRHFAQPFPNNHGLYMDNNTIILTLTEDGKNYAKHWLNRYYQQPF